MVKRKHSIPDAVIAHLGPLETRVMGVMWQLGEASVRDVLSHLEGERDSAYTTIMTVMSRLADKGLLEKSTVGKAHLYRPAMPKQVYDEARSRSRVRNLISEFGDTAIAQFAAELEEVDPERARRLGELLRRAKKP